MNEQEAKEFADDLNTSITSTMVLTGQLRLHLDHVETQIKSLIAALNN